MVARAEMIKLARGRRLRLSETPETTTRRVDLDNVPSISLIGDFDGLFRLRIFELQNQLDQRITKTRSDAGIVGKDDLRQVSDLLHGYCEF